MWKKILSLLTASCLAIGLVACGGIAPETSAGTNDATSQTGSPIRNDTGSED